MRGGVSVQSRARGFCFSRGQGSNSAGRGASSSLHAVPQTSEHPRHLDQEERGRVRADSKTPFRLCRAPHLLCLLPPQPVLPLSRPLPPSRNSPAPGQPLEQAHRTPGPDRGRGRGQGRRRGREGGRGAVNWAERRADTAGGLAPGGGGGLGALGRRGGGRLVGGGHGDARHDGSWDGASVGAEERQKRVNNSRTRAPTHTLVSFLSFSFVNSPI